MKSIILAEDDNDDAMLFSKAIKELSPDYSLFVVNDRRQILSNADHFHLLSPDLIIMDANMPKMSAQECMARIRENESLSNVPVIIISTSNFKMLADELYNAGADYYIVKQDTFEKIKEGMKDVLDKVFSGEYKRPSKDEFYIEH